MATPLEENLLPRGNPLEENLLPRQPVLPLETQSSDIVITRQGDLFSGAGGLDLSLLFCDHMLNNYVEGSDYVHDTRHNSDGGIRSCQFVMKTVRTESRDDIILDRNSMWEFIDIPLDVPLTYKDVNTYRKNKKLKDDLAKREKQRELFNKTFMAMKEEHPNVALGQPWIFAGEKLKPYDFHLKNAKILSCLCLTTKEPFSHGYFEKVPTVIHEKILTYLTGLSVLHTRVIWLSMRSRLNKHNQEYMRDSGLPRAEACFLDRVAVNLYEQLERGNRIEINEENDVNFEDWQKDHFQTIMLKKDRSHDINQSNSTSKTKGSSSCVHILKEKN